MKKILALCDGEPDYLYHMADYLERKETFPFAVHSFTDSDKLKDFAKTHEIELLVISENVYAEEMKLLAQHMVILNESGNEAGEDVDNINKFQAFEYVIKAAMESYMASGKGVPRRLDTGNRMKIIGNYTPVGGSFQTTFALSMGQLLAKEHKTLYLNFECYSGFEYLLGQKFPANIMDAVYYLNCEKEKLAYKLDGLVQSINALDYIPPVMTYQELGGVTGEQWIQLFREIERISEYEYLVLDLSEQVQGLFEVLQECSRIFTIVREGSMAEAKMRQYEEILQVMDYGGIVAKTKKWNPPLFYRIPPGIGQLTRGELAGWVRKMIEEEIYVEETGSGRGSKE